MIGFPTVLWGERPERRCVCDASLASASAFTSLAALAFAVILPSHLPPRQRDLEYCFLVSMAIDLGLPVSSELPFA